MARWTFCAGLAICVVLASHAQTAPPRPAFDVASVKLNTTCNSLGGPGPGSLTPGRFDMHCVTLRSLISMAYGAFSGGNLNSQRMEVVGGPHWLDSDRYDISAKAEGGASAPQMAPMLQSLLEDRFQVKVHVGSQEGAVYALTVLKDNSKLQRTKEGSCVPMDLAHMLSAPAVKPGEPRPMTCGLGRTEKSDGVTSISDWYGITMAEFIGRMLSPVLGRPVIDKTGLTGQYDIRLEFVLDGPIPINGQPVPAPQADSGPSIFTALETQLGLKLSATKAPVEVIFVDQAEKPSAN
jgi:uncharacterized protein (TIGR03435 family)